MPKGTFTCRWCASEDSFHAGMTWEKELAQAYGVELCPNHYILAGGPKYLPVGTKRIPYGHEKGMAHLTFNELCHDCGVKKGELHKDGCDHEECPGCHRQLLSCGHDSEWWKE